MNLREWVQARMLSLEIAPKKSLGQNFLVSERVVLEIFRCVDRLKCPFIIEVGPGLGVLTEKILERKTPYLLIEMDHKFSEYWRSRGARIEECDALRWDWSQGVENEGTLLLSNLPYQIGSRLLVEVSTASQKVNHLVLMFQKEVADRLSARPRSKDYGFLSVIAQTYWQIETITQAGRNDFLPPPKVESTVVHMTRKAVPTEFGLSYIQFVKTAFQMRRKFMLKSFTANKDEMILGLRDLGYSEKVRAEEISVSDFQKLFLRVKK